MFETLVYYTRRLQLVDRAGEAVDNAAARWLSWRWREHQNPPSSMCPRVLVTGKDFVVAPSVIPPPGLLIKRDVEATAVFGPVIHQTAGTPTVWHTR